MTAQRRTRLALLIIFAILVAITFILLPTDPLIAYRLNLLQHANVSQSAQQNDPDIQAKLDLAPGTALLETGAGLLIRKNTPFSSKGYLVVGLGDCASCMRFDVKKWQSQANALHVPLIGFSGATAEHIAAFRRELKMQFPVFFDEHTLFVKAINRYWAGRVYYFNKDWKLMWQMHGLGNDQDLNSQPGLRTLIGG